MAVSNINRFAFAFTVAVCAASAAHADQSVVYSIGGPEPAQKQECVAYQQEMLGKPLPQPTNLCSRPGQKLDVPPEVVAYLAARKAGLAAQEHAVIAQCYRKDQNGELTLNPLQLEQCAARVALDNLPPAPTPEALAFLAHFGLTPEMVR